MKKTVFFVFRKDLGTFVHVMHNAIDMKKRGHEALIVIEDKATALLYEFDGKGRFSSDLFAETVRMGLIGSVCRSCALKTETLKIAEEMNLKIEGDMNGHPSMLNYIEKGFEVIVV